ncbi:hypothetical protein FOA52_014676 [Chlamydomonas sp. UWO 241]|nr:hypothetical protein FOA52_014676 [Chlamydomonas sp. UWO 241]
MATTKVFVRLAPLERGSKLLGGSCVRQEAGQLLYLTGPSGHASETFVFDQVFGDSATNEEVFHEVVKPLAERALDGFSACAFAYGPAGAGKTHTLFGPPQESQPQPGGAAGLGAAHLAAAHLLSRARAACAGGGSGGGSVALFATLLEVTPSGKVRDLATDRDDMEVYEDAGGLTQVRDARFTELASPASLASLLAAAARQRTPGSHALLTLSVVVSPGGGSTPGSAGSASSTATGGAGSSTGRAPTTGKLHLVDLAPAGTPHAAAAHAALRAALAAQGGDPRASGGSGAAAAAAAVQNQQQLLRACTLTRLLSDALSPRAGGCACALLVALRPAPAEHAACLDAAQYARGASGASTGDSGACASPRAGSGGADGPAAMSCRAGDGGALQAEVASLRAELEMTHAHYQKLLESVAGPDWHEDYGPLERADAPPAAPGAGKPSVSIARGEGRSSSGSGSGDGSGAKRAMSRVASRLGSISGAARSGMSVSGVAAGGGGGGGGGGAFAATVKKMMEQQLNSATAKLAATESRLMAKRAEAEEFRERMLAKDFQQTSEIRKMRETTKEARDALVQEKGLARHREEAAQKRFEEEVARLSVDNDALRAQMASVSSSVSSMIEMHSAKTGAAVKTAEASADEVARTVREQVLLTAAEKDRQLENARAQAEYHLARKNDEIVALRVQLSSAKAKAAADAAALTAEGEYLVAYATKVTEILRRMEAGTYGVVERGGLRQFKVPPRDKPSPLATDRLTFLSNAVDGVDRLLGATIAAAQPPPSLTSSMAGALASRPASAQAANRLPTAGAIGGVGGVSSGSTSGAMGDGSLGGGSVGRIGGGMTPELEAMKAAWEAAMRGEITSQVVTDLRSDQTVEYMRSLETQVARYRQEVQSEKRRNNEMAVALRSVQRAGPAGVSAPGTASRPGTATGRPAAAPLPPSWGPGHSAGSVHQAGVFGRSLSSRPATAHASLGGRAGSPSAFGSVRVSPQSPQRHSPQLGGGGGMGSSGGFEAPPWAQSSGLFA